MALTIKSDSYCARNPIQTNSIWLKNIISIIQIYKKNIKNYFNLNNNTIAYFIKYVNLNLLKINFKINNTFMK